MKGLILFTTCRWNGATCRNGDTWRHLANIAWNWFIKSPIGWFHPSHSYESFVRVSPLRPCAGWKSEPAARPANYNSARSLPRPAYWPSPGPQLAPPRSKLARSEPAPQMLPHHTPQPAPPTVTWPATRPAPPRPAVTWPATRPAVRPAVIFQKSAFTL